ncbi:MAG: DUF4956 domain-containing protein [Oscillospiraceae bacterium]|nr:DUF4956 domain-containing protein [Oscillospiraceae bacterium]
MSFSDIFKKSFLDGFASTDINIYTASAAMLITSLIALYIFVLYRVLTRKTFYSKTFNISLAGIALITAGIILTIQSSIVVSLGMVGALSIVRFRTAVKDPLDLMFLFWSIAVGIICGVGMAEIAIILSIILTAGILVLNGLPVAKAPLILVVNASDLDCETEVMAVVRRYAKHCTVKSRNMTKTSLDLIIELRTGEGSKLIRDMLNISSVESASLMNHDGEVTF